MTTKTRIIRSTVLAAMAAAAPLAWAHPTYQIDVSAVDSRAQTPAGLNKRGWTAVNVDGLDEDVAWRCTKAACARIPSLPNSHPAWPTKAKAIDDLGVVVGETPSGDTMRAFRFDGTTIQDLGALVEGGDSRANGSNTLGQVVGESRDAQGDFLPFVWKAGVMTALPTLGGAGGSAFAIDDEGVIVGHAATPDLDYHAVLYRDGQIQDLGVLPGGNMAGALAINHHGQVVGESSTDGMFKTRAFIHKNGAMRELPSLPDTVSSSASSINDAGWAVGTALVHGLGMRGFAYDGTTTFDLNDALSPADQKRWKIASAVSINAKGQILVSARNKKSGAYKALTLTPQ